MKNDLKYLLYKIYQKIMKRPIFQLFLNLIDENEKIFFNYLLKNTLEGIFMNIDDWSKNILNKFEEIQKKKKENIFLNDCIIELKNSISKKINKLNKALENNSFSNLYDELVSILSNPPELLSDFQQRLIQDQHEPIYKPFSALEIELLGIAISEIKNDRIMNGVISIVEALKPESKNTRGEIIFDLNMCNQQLLHSIREYLKEQFVIEGLKYPE